MQKGFYNELLNFANALTEIEPVSTPPELVYGDLKTVHDLLKSVAEERIIAVDEDADYRLAYPQAPAEQERFRQ